MITTEDIGIVKFALSPKVLNSNIGSVTINISSDEVTVRYATNKMYTRSVQGFFIPEVDIIEKSHRISATTKISEFEGYRNKQYLKLKDFLTCACMEAVGRDAILNINFSFKGYPEIDNTWTIDEISSYITKSLILQKI